MNNKNKLIDIIQQSGCVDVWNYDTDDFKEPNPIEMLADRILADGWIRMPCKVGDAVYVIYNNKVIKGKVDSFDVVIEESDISYVAGVKFFDQIAMVKGFSFGLNVFLAKEEAERALKERER